MDRKAIVVISISVALLFLWPSLFQKLYPTRPLPESTNTVATANGAIAPTSNGTNGVSNGVPAATTTVDSAQSAVVSATTSISSGLAPWMRSAMPEQTVTLSNGVARYTFTSHGGGLKSVELLHYPETVGCNTKKDPAQNNKLANLNGAAPLPALSLLGDNGFQGDGLFELKRIADGIRAEKRLSNDLVIVKDFVLTSNYLFRCVVRLENRSAQPVSVGNQEVLVGTGTPMSPSDDGSKVGFYWGRDQRVEHITSVWFRNAYMGCVPGTPRTVYQEGSSNVTWAAVHNQFFVLAAVPKDRASSIVARELHLPGPTPQQIEELPRVNQKPVAYQASLVYSPVTIPPNQALEHSFSVYAGPKEYYTLSRLGSELKFDLEQVMGFDQVLFGSFSGLFAKILLLAMNGLHSLGIAYGLSIVVITVLIKILFWPLTQASNRSMKRMQVLQPQMKALQEKYKEDPAKLNKKMMEFWRENKVSPFGGCLPMLLQMPVFIGFFAMIQTAIELRGASFLWACDLTQPDTLFVIPGLHFPVNPMPLLMGVTMLWQARLQPTAVGVDPMQANMMKYMPLIFLFMLYNFSSGLTLYWTVQNLLSILQMKLTRARDEKGDGKSPAPGNRPGGHAHKKS